MALDAYVMPLWRFKAGDFTSPIEESLGVKPTVITLADPPPGPPWYLRLLAKLGVIEFDERDPTPAERRATAQRQVAALKKQLTKMIGTPIDWPDHGEVHYNEQYHTPIILRAFAAWHDHRDQLAEFSFPADSNYYEHPVWKLPEPTRRRFPTLVKHSLHTGYLLPVPFEGVYQVEPFKIMNHWEFFHAVASTQTIMRELRDLLAFISTVPDRGNAQAAMGGTNARWYAEELQRMCTLSIDHELPVIFHG